MIETMNDLIAVLGKLDHAAVAVSGGIDSTLLAVLASEHAGREFEVFHAVSAAVQTDGTKRVKNYAKRFGWRLHLIQTGEFVDERYLSNPINRCFSCKHNLYRTIRSITDAVILSGTNASDIGDYRPGLRAAEEFRVRHPYVEAGVTKARIRELAKKLALNDLAELPAQPCLSSRVITGTRIEEGMLNAIYAVEQHVQQYLNARIVRCRSGQGTIRIELDAAAYASLDDNRRADLESITAQEFSVNGSGKELTITFAPYAMGSAFVGSRKPPQRAGQSHG